MAEYAVARLDDVLNWGRKVCISCVAHLEHWQPLRFSNSGLFLG